VFEHDKRLDRTELVEVAEEVGNLILECTEDRKIIMNDYFNSVTIGFHYTDEDMGFVFIFTRMKVGISQIYPVLHR